MNDYQIINGKPHLGVFFGQYLYLSEDAFYGDENMNPIQIKAKSVLKNYSLRFLKKNLQLRHEQYILRLTDSALFNPLSQYGSLAYKYMIWGRAFQVMSLTKKGVKRFEKKLISGKRKYVRVDKNGY